MPLYTTLFYPNAGITNSNLIHSSLLLWDQIEYITPFADFEENIQSSNKDIIKAKELLVKPYLPSEGNKSVAHKIIIDLANSDLPEWFFYNFNEQDTYSIYPGKLLPKTWNELMESKLVKNSENPDQYVLSSSFGLIIMAILADVCAGKQKRTITDMVSAYAGLTRYFTNASNGEYKNERSQTLDDYEKLVTISLELIDVKRIPIAKLIKLREKEFGTSGSHYTKLRHNYLEKIDTYIKRLCTESLHDGDQTEILRQYQKEMEDDLNDLADALETKRTELVYSKETLVAVAATAGSIIEPVSTAIIGVGSLVRLGLNYTEAKKKLQGEHAMSWLHSLQ